MVRRGGLVAAMFVSALISGCDPTFELEVLNVQGPTVRVLVNGEEKGTVECRKGSLSLRPLVNAPPLPWRIELVALDGRQFSPIEVDGRGGGRQRIFVLDVGVLIDPGVEAEDLSPFEHLPCPT